MKQCNKCGTIKPLNQYRKLKGCRDWHSNCCKNCDQDQRRKRLSSNLESVQKRVFSQKRYNAKRNGIEFTIQMSDITFPTHCPYLGIELNYFYSSEVKKIGKGKAELNSPSFDRINIEFGYIPGNVEIISQLANQMKSAATPELQVKFAKETLRRYDNEWK